MSKPAEFADVGIQWGRGDWQNFAVTRLWSEELVVVCSPEYMHSHSIKKPSDLTNCNLLHVDDTRMWEEWFTTHNHQIMTSQPQMMLEDRHFQLSSTINGLGVSLFASWLVENEVHNGDLVNVFDKKFETSFAYHLIIPNGNETLPAVSQFSNWLLDTCCHNQ